MLKIFAVLFAARQRGVEDGAASPTQLILTAGKNPAAHSVNPCLSLSALARVLNLTGESFCHPCFGQLTIVGFSVKVSTPKSNGRMNRVFVLSDDARRIPTIALAGVPGGLASALTQRSMTARR